MAAFLQPTLEENNVEPKYTSQAPNGANDEKKWAATTALRKSKMELIV